MEGIKKVKTAVVGYGKISGIYLENMINNFEILEVVGVAGLEYEFAVERAESFGLKGMYVDEIMNDPEIELVVNLTPAPAHYDIVKMALEAGKHVYSEKILTPEYKDAIALRDLAEEKGLRLGCAPDTFLGSSIQTARKVLESGWIGEPVSCHAAINRDMGFLYYPGAFHTAKGGGIGFDVGIYYITALLSLLGPVDQVNGMVDNTVPERVIENPKDKRFNETFAVENENIMMANMKFRSNVYGTLHFTSNSIWPQDPKLVIYGTEGILHMSDPDKFGGQVFLQKKGSKELVEMPNAFGYSENSRGIGVAELAWAIRGNRPHRAGADMACHAIEILNGIVASSESGMRQTMESDFVQQPPLKEGYIGNYFGRNQEVALID